LSGAIASIHPDLLSRRISDRLRPLPPDAITAQPTSGIAERFLAIEISKTVAIRGRMGAKPRQ